MKIERFVLAGSLAAVFILGVTVGVLTAQDPVKVTPKTVKVLLENDRVRVLEARLKPGEKEPMHSHPAYVGYYLSPLKVKITSPDGQSVVRERKAGEAGWSEAVIHSTENIGTSEVHALIVELKK
ncbi:MAG: cytoplasmic protein [Acidobacteriota bacterium]